MHRRTTIALITILLVSLSCGALAATYTVKQDGTGDFTVIQRAIDAVVEGDEIVVHPGTYYENLSIVGKDIVLRSIDPEDRSIVESTVIEARNSEMPVLEIGRATSEATEVSGLVFRNGLRGIAGDASPYRTPTPRISNCIIKNNAQDGIYRIDGDIVNCEVVDHIIITPPYPSCGGGISHCDGAIVGCTIRGNVAYYGGGLYSCRGEIVNCEIVENYGYYEGGGVCSSSGMIIGCEISNNDAGYVGGGVFDFKGTIRDCIISNNGPRNDASDGPNGGGGIYLSKGDVINCLIVNNFTLEYTAGIGEHNGRVINCTIHSNYGCGISSYGNCLVENCIIRNNSDELYGSGVHPVNCCIQGWTEGGEGNFDADPLFVSGPLGDYYLSQREAGQEEDSPCVDAGSMSAAEAGLSDLSTRTDGAPDTGVVDIGYHDPTAGDYVDVEVSCSLNAVEFAPGATFQGFMSLESRGVDVKVDIFATILLPDGSIVSLTQNGFAVGIWPWYSALILPSGFLTGPEMVFDLIIPVNAASGSYTFFTAISRAGMGNFGILAADNCTFEITEP